MPETETRPLPREEDRTPWDDLRDFLEARQHDVTAAFPGQSFKQILLVVSILTYKEPALLECDQDSFLLGLIQGGLLGLRFDPALGECYLLARFNKDLGVKEATFQMGYRGAAKLVRAAGVCVYDRTDLVYAKDVFEYRFDPRPILLHEPSREADRGPITHAYAYFEQANGLAKVTVLTVPELEKIRKSSKQPNGPAWRDNTGEMYRKTVLSRGLKSFDLSPPRPAAPSPRPTSPAPPPPPKPPPPEPKALTKSAIPIAPADPAQEPNAYPIANPSQRSSFLDAMERFLRREDEEWRFVWEDGEGLVPVAVPMQLVSLKQADDHLLNWALVTKRLPPLPPPPKGFTAHPIGAWCALLYHNADPRQRTDLTRELRRHVQAVRERITESIRAAHPELFAEVKSDAMGEVSEAGGSDFEESGD